LTRDSEQVRALGAFSGGLDGMIAAKVLLLQGIAVEAVTFNSPFFDVAAGEKAAAELNIPWRRVDFYSEIEELLTDPPSGFGKNMNPCIDCHAAMFRKLSCLAAEEGFHFIFSGEVIGQRPMSQNKGSLNRVKNISGTSEVLLRPLSAKLLPPTPVEISGLVDRNGLLDISGRGRSRQISLAVKYGFSFVPAPAGGCLLTDPGYSKKLRVLMEAGLLSSENAELMKYGRMFLLPGAIGLSGRSEQENSALERMGKGFCMEIRDIPSPYGILIGATTEENIKTMASIIASYTKSHGPFTVITEKGEFLTVKISPEEREKYAIKL